MYNGEYDNSGDAFGEADCRDGEPVFLTLEFNRIVHETKAAWLIEWEIDKDLESIQSWLPKSECTITLEDKILVPEWLVEEKDLESYEVEK